MITAFLAVLAAQIPVQDHPGGAYLLYRVLPDGTAEVALSGDGESPSTVFVPFPLEFNPAKAGAFFTPEGSLLTVYSQAPFSSATVSTVYRADGWELVPVESGRDDPYRDDFDEVSALLDQGRLDDAADRVDLIMYPMEMPEGRELCFRFMEAALRCSLAGAGGECFQAADRAAMILLGIPAHQLLLSGDDAPPGCMSPEDYRRALEAYAAAMEEAGNRELSRRILENAP